MPVSDLLLEGAKLMLLGMGTVFVFLIVLVGALYAMSRLSSLLGGDEDALAEAASGGQAPPGGTTDDDLIAVISASIALYRAKHR